jgi:hypothetical protein
VLEHSSHSIVNTDFIVQSILSFSIGFIQDNKLKHDYIFGRNNPGAATSTFGPVMFSSMSWRQRMWKELGRCTILALNYFHLAFVKIWPSLR